MDALVGRPRRPPRRDHRRRLDHPRARRVPGRLRLRAGGHRRLRVLRPAGRRQRPGTGRGPAPRREAAAHPRRPAHRLQGHLPPAGRLLPARRRRGRRGRRRRARRARRRRWSGCGSPSERGRVRAGRCRSRRPAPRRSGAQRGRERPASSPRSAAPPSRPGARSPTGTTAPTPPRRQPSRRHVRPGSREGLSHASHSRAHHPLGRRQVVAAGDLRAARGLRRPADGAVDGARRAGHPGQGLRPARPRRRRLPDRHEVELHPAAQAGGDPDRSGGDAASTWWSTPTRASRAPARTCR